MNARSPSRTTLDRETLEGDNEMKSEIERRANLSYAEFAEVIYVPTNR